MRQRYQFRRGFRTRPGAALVRRIARTLGAGLWLAALTGPAAAQDNGADGGGDAHSTGPAARALRTTAPIGIDAVLDEPAWRDAKAVTAFTQTDPDEGQPATEPTEVRILYDDQALYVGARMLDSGPVSTRLARRDAFLTDSDYLTVSIDSYHDHQTAFRFVVNPSGTIRDELLSGGGGGEGFRAGGDATWDPVWQAAARITEDGWVAELRIPFSQLRFAGGDEQTWGLQLERRITRKQELVTFSFTSKRERGGVPRYGHLEGLRAIAAGQPFELLPYVAARAEYRPVPRATEVDFGNPFRSGDDYFGNAGADVKYRVASNFTLDATVNPDFGQVELDPAVINLTAFETRFDEKRPFFVEGAEIFRFGGTGGGDGGGGRGGGGGGGGGGRGGAGNGGGDDGGGPPQLLYSRRIGRAPQGSLPDDAVYANVPATTTIAAAAKLTGKTAAWSVALMEVVTPPERASYVDASARERAVAIEPLTNYLAARLRRDLRAGWSSIGAMVTAVNRSLGDDALATRLLSAAYTGGIDVRHEWADRAWSVTGSFSPSHIRGDPSAMIALQRASARYFHRPDAPHVEVDSSATSLTGYAARLDIGKLAGDWQGRVALNAVSAAYEVNDLGFQTTADRIGLDSNLQREDNVPGRLFRRWSVRGGPDLAWNYAGDLVQARFGLGSSGQFANYWSFGLNLNYEPETIDDRLTRGGPAARSPATRSIGGNLFTDFRKPVSLTASGNLRWSDDGGWRRSLNLGVTLKPADTWDLRIAPNLTRSLSTAQYVTTVADAHATRTFGRRYVFAGLEQTTLSLETRLNVIFSPRLTLELFAQPFLSSGDYASLKELRAPRTFAFDTYGEGGSTIARDAGGRYVVDPDGAGPAAPFDVLDSDFNLRSLRGNAVLRWEWHSGSTLFLVWQQARSAQLDAFEADASRSGIGGFDLSRDASELWRIQPDNIFQVKVTYWFQP